MSYTTNKIYKTHDRIIIDIRSWSFSLWTKPRLWSFAWHRRGWLCLGPLEIFHHGRWEYGA
jgi:hypothetical protein